jgi:hypothetical protein
VALASTLLREQGDGRRAREEGIEARSRRRGVVHEKEEQSREP